MRVTSTGWHYTANHRARETARRGLEPSPLPRSSSPSALPAGRSGFFPPGCGWELPHPAREASDHRRQNWACSLGCGGTTQFRPSGPRHPLPNRQPWTFLHPPGGI